VSFAPRSVCTSLRGERPDLVNNGLDLDVRMDSGLLAEGVHATNEAGANSLSVGHLGSRCSLTLSTGINSGTGAGAVPYPISCLERTSKAY